MSIVSREATAQKAAGPILKVGLAQSTHIGGPPAVRPSESGKPFITS